MIVRQSRSGRREGLTELGDRRRLRAGGLARHDERLAQRFRRAPLPPRNPPLSERRRLRRRGRRAHRRPSLDRARPASREPPCRGHRHHGRRLASPPRHRHGVAQAAVDWARKADVQKLELHVFPRNGRRSSSTRSFGFVQEGYRRAHYRRGDEFIDAILMAYDALALRHALARLPRQQPELVFANAPPPSPSAPRTLRSTAGRGRRGAPTVPRTPAHASGRAGPPPLRARSRRQPRAREPRPAQQPPSATLPVRRGPKRRDRARAGARRDEAHAPPTRESVPPPRARHATCSRVASR